MWHKAPKIKAIKLNAEEWYNKYININKDDNFECAIFQNVFFDGIIADPTVVKKLD